MTHVGWLAMTRFRILSALSATLLLGSGCTTLYDASGHTPLGQDGPHIYGGMGTILIGDRIPADYFRGMPKIETSSSGWKSHLGLAALLISPVAADIALSLAVDTIIFPYTLSREIHER